jgi:hypothetical protein
MSLTGHVSPLDGQRPERLAEWNPNPRLNVGETFSFSECAVTSVASGPAHLLAQRRCAEEREPSDPFRLRVFRRTSR